MSEYWRTGQSNPTRTGRKYPWSARQLRSLRRQANKGLPYKLIAKALGRSYTSVCQRARVLGIRKLKRKGR